MFSKTTNMILCVILFVSVYVYADEQVLYVATNGNDAWSGTLAEPNPTATDGPLKTLTAARNRVLNVKWDIWGGIMQKPITVYIREGIYYQTPTFQLYWYDSGAEGKPISYKAYPGEQPIFSGGKALPALSKVQGQDYYSANIPEAANRNWKFRRLWIDEKSYTFARSPNTGYYYVAAIPEKPAGLDDYWENYWYCHHFNYNANDLKLWSGLAEGDITMQVFSLWEVQTVILGSVTPASKRAYTENHVLWGLNPSETITAGGQAKRYIVENAPDALDYPGEWQLNRVTGELRVIPFGDEDLSVLTAVAPITQTAVHIAGSPDNNQFVEYINFEGIAFRHYASPPILGGNSGGYKSNQGASNHPACVQLDGVRHIQFLNCEISRNGTHGLQMSRGCTNNRIEGCHIYDVGAGGIYIGERLQTNQGYDPGEYGATSHNIVHNNYIHHGGQEVQSGMGIIIAQSHNNTITNNEISHFKQSGMQIGWNWDTSESYSHDNLISHNRIHNIGMNISGDLGAIYTVGENFNTLISNNVMHTVYCWIQVNGKGLYPDQNTKGVAYQNNIVYDVAAYGIGVNFCHDITVENNIFASNYGKAPFMFGHQAYATITNNIFYLNFGNVYADNRDLIRLNWFVECNQNIYWRKGGKPVLFQKPSADSVTVTERIAFEQWQDFTGLDADSYVIDPMFNNPDAGDFSFKQGSPYSEIGFTPIDTSQVGLIGEEDWRMLPNQFNDGKKYAWYYEPFYATWLTAHTYADDGFAFGFEYNIPNTKPKAFTVFNAEQTEQASPIVIVSDENPSKGNYSVKVVSDGGQLPQLSYITFDPIIFNGDVRFSCDFYRQPGAGIEIVFADELSQTTAEIANDGKLSFAQEQLLTLDEEKWFTLEITFSVGRGARQFYDVVVFDGAERIFEQRITADSLELLNTVSINALEDNAMFYVDQVSVRKIGGGAFGAADRVRTDMTDYGMFAAVASEDEFDLELAESLPLSKADINKLAENWLAYNPEIIAGAWNFAGGSGSTAASNVYGGFDLSLVGNEGWGAEGFLFDGSNYFTAPKTSAGYNLNFLKDFKVTAKIKITDTDTNTIWSRLNSTWQQGCKQFLVQGGKLKFDCGWVGTVSGNYVVNDGQWHEVAVRYVAALNRIDIFVDGNLDVSEVLANDLKEKPDDFDFFVGCQQELEPGVRHAPFRGTIRNMLIQN